MRLRRECAERQEVDRVSSAHGLTDWTTLSATPTVKRCPFCAEEIQDAAIVCGFCSADLVKNERQPAAVVIMPPVRTWSPGVAAILSLVIPGAGQLYSGRVVQGLAWLFGVVFAYLWVVPYGLILHIICIIVAASASRAATDGLTIAEHQADDTLNGLKRLPSTDLAFPVLLLQRDAYAIWCHERALEPVKGLLVDSHGLSYQMVDLDLRSLQPPLLPRAERRRRFEQGIPQPQPTPPTVLYRGEPVQVSLDQVRESIVWLVSAQGHFEIPQGLPTLSFVDSVEELLGVLLANGSEWQRRGFLSRHS